MEHTTTKMPFHVQHLLLHNCKLFLSRPHWKNARRLFHHFLPMGPISPVWGICMPLTATAAVNWFYFAAQCRGCCRQPQAIAINLEPHKPPCMARWNNSQHNAFHPVPQSALPKAVSLAFLPSIHLSEIISGNTAKQSSPALAVLWLCWALRGGLGVFRAPWLCPPRGCGARQSLSNTQCLSQVTVINSGSGAVLWPAPSTVSWRAQMHRHKCSVGTGRGGMCKALVRMTQAALKYWFV